MRKLLYVPVVHENMDSLNAQSEKGLEGMLSYYGVDAEKHMEKVREINEKVNDIALEYWDGVERGLDDESIDYKSTMIFQDGFWFGEENAYDIICGHIKLMGESRNMGILKRMAEKGAKIKKTESPELVEKQKHALIMFELGPQAEMHPASALGAKFYYNCPDCSGKVELRKADWSEVKEVINERDMYIADRINEGIGEGEMGILFIGAEHDPLPYLSRDIEIKKIQPFDVVKRLKDLEKDIYGRMQDF